MLAEASGTCSRHTAPRGEDNIRWIRSQHDILELLSSLHVTNCFGCDSGRRPSFTGLVRKVCRDWGIEVGDIFAKRRQIFDRVKNSTPFLDELKSALEELIEKRLE